MFCMLQIPFWNEIIAFSCFPMDILIFLMYITNVNDQLTSPISSYLETDVFYPLLILPIWVSLPPTSPDHSPSCLVSDSAQR